MGQYYKPVFLGTRSNSPKHWVRCYDFDNGAKLMEHSYIGNNFMKAVEALLIPSGLCHKTRLVWAGDYAEHEEGKDQNLYSLCKETSKVNPEPLTNEQSIEYRYIVNHTKKLYVDKSEVPDTEEEWGIHPLSLLTSDGNGQGGGDYFGEDNDNLVGSWKRDVISIEKSLPDPTFRKITAIFPARVNA